MTKEEALSMINLTLTLYSNDTKEKQELLKSAELTLNQNSATQSEQVQSQTHTKKFTKYDTEKNKTYAREKFKNDMRGIPATNQKIKANEIINDIAEDLKKSPRTIRRYLADNKNDSL